MNSVFRALYLGEISPTELHLPRSPEYRQILSALGPKYDYFTQVLKAARPDLNRVYEELCEFDMQLDAEEKETMFFHGLSIGIMLVTEAMITAQGVKL